MSEKKSLGEQRVRTDFNVSGSSIVDAIKQKSAELINLCEDLKSKDARLASLAQTSYEEAAMWAVKAATAEIHVPSSETTTNEEDDDTGGGGNHPGKPGNP